MRLVIFCHLFIAILAFGETPVAPSAPASTTSKVIAQKKLHKRKPRTKISTYKSIRNDKYKGYKITEIPQYKIPPLLSREDLNKIIPSNVSATDPSNNVLKKIGDKAVNVWLKSSSMQQVSIVRAANKVEQAMKAEVDLAPDSDVKQKLNFQVQAFQTLSRIDYTGYVDATVSYNLRDQKTGYEIRHKVFRNKDLYVNHTDSKSESLSSVGLKWSF
jgi:hypothetical protein